MRFLIQLLLLLLLLLFSGCKSEYTKLVEDGLSSGDKVDTLIFDMPIGLKKKEFYSRCWELNSQQMISQGSGNNMAKYEHKIVNTIGDSADVEMLFYGIFDEDNLMQGMDMEYSYAAWSPWIEWAQPQALAKDLVKFYEAHYPGNDFISIDMPAPIDYAYVKIDGSREILIYQDGNRSVIAKIQDLHYKLKR